MSQTISPPALDALGTHIRFSWLRRSRGRLRFAALTLLALPVLATALLGLHHQWGRDLYDNILEIHFRFLVLFLPALATSQSVGEEIDQKTFTFVFSRPAPRWTMPVGKYIAAVVPLWAGFTVSLLLSFVIAMLIPPSSMGELIDNLPMLGRSIVAACLGVAVFAALATLLGTWVTRHAFAAIMGYLLLVEGLIGSLPLVISLLAMSWHLRNVAGIGSTTQSALLGLSQPQINPGVSALALILVTALALWGAAKSIEHAEYRTDR